MLTTALWVQALAGQGEAPAGFIGAVALWLWFTVLFANFAEAVAEGRGKAQAEALRRTRKRRQAKKTARSRDASAGGIDVVLFHASAQGRLVPGRGRRHHPRRRRDRSKASPRWTKAPSPARARR